MLRAGWAVLATALFLHNPVFPQTRRVSDEEVRRVHASALLIDTHNDVTSETVQGLDIGPRREKGHTDLPRLREGGVGAVFFAAYVAGSYENGNRSANRALEMIDTVRHDIVARYPNDFEFALTAADIVAARKRGKIAALIGIEGGHAIESSPRLLRDFFALGVRYMTLTHSNSNHWAGSSGDERGKTTGLNELGRQIVVEMNRLGMIVDISHVSDKTFYNALDASRAPVFASHSSCRALADVPRNMTDDMIRALGKKNGVIQINFNCGFLVKTPPGGKPAATLADVVAHIDHAVKLAGVEHVGIGSDYDGVSCTPAGLEDNSKYPALTRALLEKGYPAADIRKIYGENTLRLMRAVEAAAQPSSQR
jgi:membrane dipeptidase